MKNLQNIILGVLTLGMAVLFFLHFKGNSSGPAVKMNPNSKDMASAAGSRIALINKDTLNKRYKKIIALEKEIEAAAKAADNSLEAKAKAMQADYAKVAQQFQNGQLPQTQAPIKQKEFQNRQLALEKEKEALYKNITDKKIKTMEELYKKLDAYFEENKTKYNYDYVMGYQTNLNILYRNKALDITNSVLEDLNKE